MRILNKIFSIFVIVIIILLSSGCDFFKKSSNGFSSVDFYIDYVKVPVSLLNENRRAEIYFSIQKISSFGNEGNIESGKEFQLLSPSITPALNIKVKNASYQPRVTVILSPKATIDIYENNLKIDTNSLTLAATILNATLTRYESNNLSSYDYIDINNDENFYILFDFSKISDIYSDNAIATPNIYFARGEDLVNIKGRILGDAEYRLEFISPYYSYSTFTKFQDYSIKLFKGSYDLFVDVYEFDNTFSITSTEVKAIEDLVLNIPLE